MMGEAYENIFTAVCRSTMKLAETFVAAVQDCDRDNPVRCHELARAVARALADTPYGHVEVVDGHFGMVEHSWISLDRETILDVYVPGSAPMVQLVHFSPLLPSYRSYKRGAVRTDIDWERVAKIVSQMRTTRERLCDVLHAPADWSPCRC